MVQIQCLCGQLSAETATRPEFIHECNCTLCRKSGARWGYFHPDDVSTAGTTSTFSRADKDEPAAQLHFCPVCGTTTHFTLTEAAAAKFGNTMMGVNLRLADERDLAGIELRFPDGAAWGGAGEFGYVRDSVVIGDKLSSPTISD